MGVTEHLVSRMSCHFFHQTGSFQTAQGACHRGHEESGLLAQPSDGENRPARKDVMKRGTLNADPERLFLLQICTDLLHLSMKFQWDDPKSRSNLEKHGIDFEAALKLWVGPNRVEIHAPYPLENRRPLIGRIDQKIWTAIYTLRGDEVRIISVRRARRKEVRLYEGDEVGQE